MVSGFPFSKIIHWNQFMVTVTLTHLHLAAVVVSPFLNIHSMSIHCHLWVCWLFVFILTFYEFLWVRLFMSLQISSLHKDAIFQYNYNPVSYFNAFNASGLHVMFSHFLYYRCLNHCPRMFLTKLILHQRFSGSFYQPSLFTNTIF